MTVSRAVSVGNAPVQGSSVPAERPLRADAQRNRDSLITAARAAFTAADDSVPLEDVARAAGVGIGTLYRNFPTREALVEAVYATGLDEVTASVESLLETLSPAAALRAWVRNYADFSATKRGMADTLRAGWASGRIATPATRVRITAAVETLLAAGIRDGSLRADVVADDVTSLLLGVFLSTAGNPSADQTQRLLDLVVDGVSVRVQP